MKLVLHIWNGLFWKFPLTGEGPWRIGRKSPSEILVNNKCVSAVHAELSMAQNGLLLRKLKAVNPIRIAGKEIDSVLLNVGMKFTIESTQFALADEDSPEFQPDIAQFDSREILADSTPVITKAANTRVSAVQFIRDISRLTAISGEDDLNRAVLNWVCDKLGAQRGMLTRTVSTGGQIAVATTGFDSVINIHDLISTTVLKKVLEDLHTVFISDLSCDDSFNTKLSVVANEISAVACAPLFNPDSSVAGLIYVDNRGRERRFEREDAEFLLWAGQFLQLYSETIRLRQRLEVQVGELKRCAERDVSIVAESKEILDILALAKRIAPSNANVLILGETGSGKESVAEFIHRQSLRAKGRFVVRNCAAIPSELFESEIFGHMKGSFTGANSDRGGAFEEAAGGTLFLDEIGDLEYGHQAKLLRAVENKRIRRVGGDNEFFVDVRIICATNRDLKSLPTKVFRSDLFFRVETLTLEVPPLRFRRDDIVPLARHFVKQLNAARILTPEAETLLKEFDWPGNIRQLRSAVERAVYMSTGMAIQSSDISLPKWRPMAIIASDAPGTLADAERQHIINVMRQVGENITHAATKLDISRSTLVTKLRSYGIT